jgi:phage I-like protein
MDQLKIGMTRVQKIGGEPPEAIRLFPNGLYECEDGTYIADAESRRLCIEYFQQRGNDDVIDYEHATLYGGPAPASGWVTALEDRGDDGLWGKVEWTERAQEHIRAGEYRYYSPVFDIDPKTQRVVRLHNVALTNWPGSNNMNALTEQIAASVVARRKQTVREGVMEKFLEKLKALIARPTTATGDELRADVNGLLDVIPAGGEPIAQKADKPTFAEMIAPEPSAPVEIVANKTLLDELELPETATIAQAHARIGELKTRTSPEDLEQMRAENVRLATRVKELEAKSDDEKLKLLFESNRKKVTPAKEKWLRTVAEKHGFDHVSEIVKALKDELPTTADVVEPPVVETPIAPKERADGRPVNQKAAERHAKVMKLAASKSITYEAANEELRREERAAAVK